MQVSDFLTSRRATWQLELSSAEASPSALQALLSELRDSVLVVGRAAGTGTEDAAVALDVQTRSLLTSWRDARWDYFTTPSWRGMNLPDDPVPDRRGDPCSARNVLKMSYHRLYSELQLVDRCTSSDVATAEAVVQPAAVCCSVVSSSSAPAAAAPAAAAFFAAATAAAASTTSGPAAPTAPAREAVVVAVTVEADLMDARFQTLQASMRAAMTNFERVELAEAFAGKPEHKSAARSGSLSLTCSQLAHLAETLTLGARRKDVLIALHPFVSDGTNFPTMVDEQLTLIYEREEVRRAVARAERRAWLDRAYHSDD